MAVGLTGSVPLRLLGSFARRLVLLVILLAVVFSAVALLPGNAATATLGREASAADVAARAHSLGLDRPLPTRFVDWLGGLVTGDLGVSAHGEPISGLIGSRFPNTLLLGGLALAVTAVASVLLGAWWAARPDGWAARLLTASSTMVIAVPEFVVATLLVLVFALWAPWFPAVTMTSATGTPAAAMLVLPVLSLAIPQTGWNTRVVRAALTDASSAPHVKAAVLDGLSARRVLSRHVLPLALPTIATSIATTVGMLLGGAVIVETVFNYPGLGAVIAGSVTDRDAPLIAVVVALTGTTIMIVLMLADVVRAWSTRGRR